MATFSWKNTGSVSGAAVTVDDLKKHLEIATSDTSHNGQLALLVQAAVKQFEAQTRYLIGTRTVSIKIDHFAAEPLYLPIRPINSLTTFTYNGTDFSTKITTDFDSEPPRIYPNSTASYTWPAVTEPIANITITASAGQDVASLPVDIRQSILLLAAAWFEYREDFANVSLNRLPHGVKEIWDSYRLADGYLLAYADGGNTNAPAGEN